MNDEEHFLAVRVHVRSDVIARRNTNFERARKRGVAHRDLQRRVDSATHDLLPLARPNITPSALLIVLPPNTSLLPIYR